MSEMLKRSAPLTESEATSFVTTKAGERKFIGGAAMARLNAKRRPLATNKKAATRILRPDEVQKSMQCIPSGLSSFETFFACLLRSEVTEYLPVIERGGKRAISSRKVLETICQRLSLPAPIKPVASCYPNIKDHFSHRAALVLEEARFTIEDGLRRIKQDSMQFRSSSFSNGEKGRGQKPGWRLDADATSLITTSNGSTMVLRLTGIELKERSGHSILTFLKETGPFTRDEMQSLRHGTVFVCHDRGLAPNVTNSILGCVIPQSREDMTNMHSFAIMIFKRVKKSSQEIWDLTPIASLLSEQRMFDACIGQISKPVSFVFPLLGMKEASHVKFHEDDDGNTYEVSAESHDDAPSGNDDDSDCQVLEFGGQENAFVLPTLNEMQEKAARSYLSAKKDTITLIQGPPGTGKTTLLVSVICRYIMESRHLHHSKRCLMVCAPTNKAVTVLCGRFLESIKGDILPCNAVLVGDDDKLLDDDRGRKENGGERSKLRSIFLYTFIDTIKEDYLFIRNELARNGLRCLQSVRVVAHRLCLRLKSNISDKQVVNMSERIVKQLTDESQQTPVSEAISSVDLILAMIGDWKPDNIWHELVRGADVIFCTLASSGASFLKKIVQYIDDLIVDEAAAATEPEMYIPFQFLPRRLLAVGDPKQLPATVSSHVAEQLGLSKSLHERLMYDCNYRHIMLDTQYRMKPELSQFPSRQFYEARLRDGPNVIRPDYNGGTGMNMMGYSPYAICEVNGTEQQARSGSYENEAEAQAVVMIVDDFCRASRTYAGRWCSPDRIRIITFYQAQVSLIKRLLFQRNFGDVLVATVDSSQGCEAEYVIVSFVRSTGRSNRNSVGFLTDDRRLNVAITRAKYQLICVGNVERMAGLTDTKAETVKRLACDAFDRRCVVPFRPRLASLSKQQPQRTLSSSTMMNQTRPPPESQQSRVNPTVPLLTEPIDSGKRLIPANSDPRKRRLTDSELPSTIDDFVSQQQEQERNGENRTVSSLNSCTSSSSSSSCSSSTDTSHTSSSSSSFDDDVTEKWESL